MPFLIQSSAPSNGSHSVSELKSLFSQNDRPPNAIDQHFARGKANNRGEKWSIEEG
jgi:hypothetical protein